MASASFSTSGEEAITRTIDLNEDLEVHLQSPSEFDDFYEIERTANEIVAGGYKRIAMQFPDELLHDSVPVFKKLKEKVGKEQELYVLADTSYGSCCVDEVAAQHVDADLVVHYGHACMSQTSRLAVIYVFGQRPLDIELCASRLIEALDVDSPCRTVKLLHDVSYSYCADQVAIALRSRLANLGFQVVYQPISTQSSSQPRSSPMDAAMTAEVDPDLPIPILFYVGAESLYLTNLLLTNASSPVYSYNPSTQAARLESSRTNKLLMRRYVAVQHARNGDVFGILVGTLGVSSYLPLIRHLRTILKQHHKKSYTISVGKLNPAKLANFMEIECFVLVACPENSIIDSKEFLRPIVTPYELEIALRTDQSWTGKYVLDFDKLLSDSPREKDLPSSEQAGFIEEKAEEDQPTFSLITGTYRQAKRYGEDNKSDTTGTERSSALILRNQDNEITKMNDSAAGEFLLQRSYRGLEPRVGEDAPSTLEQGRSGIARGYQDDHQ